ncbi:MAG: M15 family metallopeptidase [Anaerolineae bacterium]|nr:M15 family metallopeptidase [Anaerolineae bacterium]
MPQYTRKPSYSYSTIGGILLLLAVVLARVCTKLPSGKTPGSLDAATVTSAAAGISAVDFPTPQPSATQPALRPTATTAVPITIYNQYIGKDTSRQPELIQEPPAEIISIKVLEQYPGSYIDTQLDGKTIANNEIRGEVLMLEHILALMEAAKEQGFESQTIYSTYRTFQHQVFLSNRSQSLYTQDTGDYLASPGRSEHHLGTAVDIGWGSKFLDFDTINTIPAAKEFYAWLQTNAHLFGFVFSYPFKSNQDDTRSNYTNEWLTEYKAEPWHLRYVGVTFAGQIYDFSDEAGRNYLDPYSTIIPQQFYLP